MSDTRDDDPWPEVALPAPSMVPCPECQKPFDLHTTVIGYYVGKPPCFRCGGSGEIAGPQEEKKKDA